MTGTISDVIDYKNSQLLIRYEEYADLPSNSIEMPATQILETVA
jgi:hypothetical protein